jgi:hypothetical protein
VGQRSVEDRVDTVSVSIGDLTVVATPEVGPPNGGRHSWHRPAAVAMAVVLLVAGAVVGRSLLDDNKSEVVPAAAGLPTLPDPLSVDVTSLATTVVYGEPMHLQFAWSDGDGTLIDVNHVESTAVSYRRDVPCDKAVARPHAISDTGSWTYTPDAMNFGPPPTTPRLVHVGLEVRTGGCAPTERVVTELAVTVLPPT